MGMYCLLMLYKR